MRIFRSLAPLALCIFLLIGCSQNKFSSLFTGNQSALRYRDIPWHITPEELLEREGLSEEAIDRFTTDGELRLIRKELVSFEGLALPTRVVYVFFDEKFSGVLLFFYSEDEASCIEVRDLILTRMAQLIPLERYGQPISLEDAKRAPVADGITCQADNLSTIAVSISDPFVNGNGQYCAGASIYAGYPE